MNPNSNMHERVPSIQVYLFTSEVKRQDIRSRSSTNLWMYQLVDRGTLQKNTKKHSIDVKEAVYLAICSEPSAKASKFAESSTFGRGQKQSCFLELWSQQLADIGHTNLRERSVVFVMSSELSGSTFSPK